MSLPDELIQRIHQSGYQMVLGITGGGASAIGELLRVPGGSKSVLEAVVPYAWESLVEWLGGAPDHACSDRTARAMAMQAFTRARRLAGPAADADHLLGVACTASLASDRPKRGAHRFHLAVQSAGFTGSLSIKLEKDVRTRAEEEALVTRLLICYIATHCGIDLRSLPVLDSIKALTTVMSSGATTPPLTPRVRELLLGSTSAVLLSKQGDDWIELADQQPPSGALVFPGAFNPVHAGHRAMAEYACARLQAPLIFELSIENVAKPPLDYAEIANRMRHFASGDQVCLSRAATFREKSQWFPGATFLVGVDTIVRVADPRFAGSQSARDEGIATIAARGCRFLVFGRVTSGGQFQGLDDASLPHALAALCDGVPEADFRRDLSSTELRQQEEQQQQ